jgi:methionyl-tRNA formyltransferase
MSAGGKLCVLAAYHEMGAVALECVLRHGWEVALVYTHADDPNENVWWRSVASLAGDNGIPVDTVDINDPAQAERIRAAEPDYLFSVYYRRLIRPGVLELFPKGAYNLHGSLLPKYRGRAPVNWAVIAGEVETGVTLHHMVAKADAGDVVDQEWVPIEDDDSALQVYQKMCEASINVWDRCLSWFDRGKAPRFPQDLAKGSYRGARRPEDGKIDFAWSAKRCFDLIRGVARPYPGAFGMAGQQKFLIWWATPAAKLASGRTAAPGTVLSESGVPHVACGEGFLRLEKVQPPGASEMDAPAAARAGHLPEGMRFQASSA